MNKKEIKKSQLLQAIGQYILHLKVEDKRCTALYLTKIEINQWIRHYTHLLEQDKVLSPSDIALFTEKIDTGLWKLGALSLTYPHTPFEIHLPMVERLKRHLWLLLEQLHQYSETFYHQAIW